MTSITMHAVEEALSGPVERQSSQSRLLVLGAVSLLTALVRLWLIRHFPEPDTDVPGHLGIAHAVLSDPTNVAIHWVWLPAYHFILAALLTLGFSADGIRVLNCALASLVPLLVLRYGESTVDPALGGASRYAPWMAAVFCAISPLVNLLGTSAQQETLFTLLVLGAVWSIDLGRFALAGALLAVAALIRYETWGAVALLVGLRAAGGIPAVMKRLPEGVARSCRLPFVIAAPSIAAIGGWLLARKLREGQWLGFLRELYRYTHVQRESLHRELLWFPVQQPLFVFGPIVVALFFVGLRRAWRPSHVVPLGIYLFLMGAYLFKGALGSARYYESLTPFVALSAAHGACVIGSRRRWIAPALFVLASSQLLHLSAQLCRWTWPSVAEASFISGPRGEGAAYVPSVEHGGATTSPPLDRRAPRQTDLGSGGSRTRVPAALPGAPPRVDAPSKSLGAT
ncbi:MAG: hypothetical protein ACLQVI_42355 [Polyangiaceae bacterium]